MSKVFHLFAYLFSTTAHGLYGFSVSFSHAIALHIQLPYYFIFISTNNRVNRKCPSIDLHTVKNDLLW